MDDIKQELIALNKIEGFYPTENTGKNPQKYFINQLVCIITK